MWMAFQLVIGIVSGSWAMWYSDHFDDVHGLHHGGRRALTLWGFIFGMLVTRAVMFLIVWCRFGWSAARGMRLLDKYYPPSRR